MTELAFDVVVVGAGPAGEVAAGRLAERGHVVAIVESDLVGGECSFYACMPSKALLRPAEVLAEAGRVPGAAEAIAGAIDVPALLARRDQIVNDLHDDHQLPWLEQRGITLLRGHGRLAGDSRVVVGGRTLVARRAVIIAVGSTAVLPPIPGLQAARPWTNREATTANEIPGRLLVLGGGVVGVEMAQAYSSLGSKVTLVEAASRLLPREEPFAGEHVAKALTARGVIVHIGEGVDVVHRRATGEVAVGLADHAVLIGDELLVAVGRRPLTDDLGLDTVGLPAGRWIEVDDHLRVPRRPWLYAIGDVNGRSLLTHMGKYQARVVSEVIDGRDLTASRDDGGAARVVFTDPQVASVGLTESAARQTGLDVLVVDHPIDGTAGASFHGRGAEGTARLVFDAARDVVVGATFAGPDVADLLHAATVAVVGEVPVDRLWEAVAPFPTRSEL